MRLISGLACLWAVATGCQATVFIDGTIEIVRFHDFEGSPYYEPKSWHFPPIVDQFVDVDCGGIARQAAQAASFTALYRQAQDEKTKATTENDRDRAAALESKAEQLRRRASAARGVQSVLESRPIRGRYRIHPGDPMAGFLFQASHQGVGAEAWIKSVQLKSIQSPLPVTTRKPVTISHSYRRFDMVDATFAKTDVRDPAVWAASVGMKGPTVPLQASVGWNPVWLHCDFWTSTGVSADCMTPAVGLRMSLTQGQFCAARSGDRSALVTINMEYPSPLFRQSADVTLRIGHELTESEAQAMARREGHNLAIDRLVAAFIKDVFGVAKLFTVDDSVLAPFDGGYYEEGKVIEVGFDEGTKSYSSRRLRDALMSINKALAAANDAPSEGTVVKLLSAADRYTGARRAVRDKDVHREFVEFKLPRTSGDVIVGFVVSGSSVRVGYLLHRGEPVYLHPVFICSRGRDFGCPAE